MLWPKQPRNVPGLCASLVPLAGQGQHSEKRQTQMPRVCSSRGAVSRRSGTHPTAAPGWALPSDTVITGPHRVAARM